MKYFNKSQRGGGKYSIILYEIKLKTKCFAQFKRFYRMYKWYARTVLTLTHVFGDGQGKSQFKLNSSYFKYDFYLTVQSFLLSVLLYNKNIQFLTAQRLLDLWYVESSRAVRDWNLGFYEEKNNKNPVGIKSYISF